MPLPGGPRDQEYDESEKNCMDKCYDSKRCWMGYYMMWFVCGAAVAMAFTLVAAVLASNFVSIHSTATGMQDTMQRIKPFLDTLDKVNVLINTAIAGSPETVKERLSGLADYMQTINVTEVMANTATVLGTMNSVMVGYQQNGGIQFTVYIPVYQPKDQA